jgi:hypothetical protein
VSPDQTQGWDGVYGRSEVVRFRSAQWVRVYREAATAGTGSITGRVVGHQDERFENALVELVSMSDVAAVRTDAQGEFHFNAIPSGQHALRATKSIGGLIYENCSAGPERPAEDCGLVIVQPQDTVSTVLRLGPPSRNRRLVTANGMGTITDDEVGVDNEVGDRDFFEAGTVSPLEREREFTVRPRCVGGEVIVTMTFNLTLLEDDLTVHVMVTAKLFEGTDCDTRDLEDTVVHEVDIFEGEGTQVGVILRNGGVGGGDHADYLIDITNLQEP